MSDDIIRTSTATVRIGADAYTIDLALSTTGFWRWSVEGVEECGGASERRDAIDEATKAIQRSARRKLRGEKVPRG